MCQNCCSIQDNVRSSLLFHSTCQLQFGCNVFIRCHTDDDFTLSMAHILLDGHDQYKLDDDTFVFFCFPTLGVAVPMRPGDFLIFNSRLPHCISTWCRHSEKIMCISMFLKTLVVGETTILYLSQLHKLVYLNCIANLLITVVIITN